jgi:hypothetical protein
MSIGFAIAIYTALVAFVSFIMLYYLNVMYPREEAQLKEKSK